MFFTTIIITIVIIIIIIILIIGQGLVLRGPAHGAQEGAVQHAGPAVEVRRYPWGRTG